MPSSRSLRMAIAVKLFVIDAMRNAVSSVDGRLALDVPVARHPDVGELPSMTMPHAAPGTWVRVTKS